MIGKKFCLALSLFCLAEISYADADPFRYTYYVGVNTGYGSTTWGGLVPVRNSSLAIRMSTPVYVSEGGFAWGAYAGHEFTPNFAVEASYLRYPNAKVRFSQQSLYAFDHNGNNNLNTHTESVSLLAKIMLTLPRSNNTRIYSGAGVATTHRYDMLLNQWHATPTFGIGANYNLNDHWMLEFAGSYTAGYGESELNPAQDYMPFLYAVLLRVAYRC